MTVFFGHTLVSPDFFWFLLLHQFLLTFGALNAIVFGSVASFLLLLLLCGFIVVRSLSLGVNFSIWSVIAWVPNLGVNCCFGNTQK